MLPFVDVWTLLSNATAWQLILLVFMQVVFVTMVYGPIAAYLVEAFPAKIRYTALSLPYHIGNGVFGGLLPVIGLSIVARDGKHLRRPLLPDCRGRADVRDWLAAAHRNAQRADLEGSAGRFRVGAAKNLTRAGSCDWAITGSPCPPKR